MELLCPNMWSALLTISTLLLTILVIKFEQVHFIMPPTSKKLEGHIASGLFVRPSVRPFVTLFDA